MYDGVLRDFDTPEIDPYLVKRAHDTFHVAPLSAADFTDKRPHAVIGMVPGEIVSEDAGYADHIDLEQDILKIAVIERHKNTHHIGLGYIKGYGLRHGAVATSISHDSHNIIVVGTSEEDMAAAANRIVENRGGITVMDGGQILGEVALPIAGIMSDDSLVMVNSALEAAKDAEKTDDEKWDIRPETPDIPFESSLYITNSRACPSAAVCYVWGRKIPMEKMGSRRCQVFSAAKEVNHSRSRLQIQNWRRFSLDQVVRSSRG